MFDRILIANRGEIACRIIRTCRAMGVGAVAVHSSADRFAPHVALADRAVRIGASPPALSYLDGAAIIEAALEAGAGAVHPGFGFLSENAEFAAACADAGLVFIGPSAGAIRAMGSKTEAKRLARAAGVPVLGAGDDVARDDSGLAAAADAIGFPVMVKPAAGGGGRGMRVVAAAAALPAALAAARREALSSFGDDTLLVEEHVGGARHIEVQVFGDSRGGIVHLHERECSVQRRHQKLVEEAPAPALAPALREGLAAAAVAAARAVDYRGAGTVEFLVAPDGRYWFIEMNTRLQVEHPVTEMVTGIDLVEWQLRIAAGEPLPLRQDEIACTGHAVEARLCAEDPGDGFRPGFGRLGHLALPAAGDGLRVDAGVAEGDEITVHYDSMIAKIIAHGRDRAAACDRLSAALGAVRVAGPATNERFLRAVVDHPEFRAGRYDTGFVDRHLDRLVPPEPEIDADVLALAALAVLSPPPTEDRGSSPWSDRRGWRLGGLAERRVRLVSGGQAHGFVLRPGVGLAREDGGATGVGGEWTSPTVFAATTASAPVEAVVIRDGAALTVFARGRRHVLAVDDPLLADRSDAARGGMLSAPMPGVVSAVNVSPGDAVAAGDVLMIIEAMKVEHAIRAPADGRVASVGFAPGDRVREGVELVVLDTG